MDIIIGGGVTGISYAAFTSNPYMLIEKEKECGGYCRTIARNGFVWDYSGHFFHFRNPRIEEFVCRHMNRERLVHVNKHTQIYYKGNYIDFPFQKNIHQLEKDEFIDCLYDLFQADSTKSPTSFKEMVYNNYGKSIADKFLIPYNEKLYACDLNRLDSDAMGRFFPQASKEEIIANFRNSDNNSYNSSFVYSKDGAISYIDSLMKRLESGSVFTGEEVLSIDRKQKRVKTNLRELKYEHLISTMPFPRLLELCEMEYESAVYSCNKVLVFNLGFDRKGRDIRNHWVYFPENKYVFYRVGYYDNIQNTDRMSLYVEIGWKENENMGVPQELLQRVIADLKNAGIIEGQQLVDYEMIVMKPAYVHINHKQLDDLVIQKKKLEEENIYSIGRYGSWTYCSIEDNILEAEQLALKLNK